MCGFDSHSRHLRMTKQKLIIILGATACGKSALAVELARKFNGEVISADSRQVYRGLDIGTGKITKKEMKGVPHHLLDVESPKKIFTAQDFVTQAGEKVKAISSRGGIPIVCGGTGFYIDALVGRVPLPNVAADPELRAKLDTQTLAELFSYLGRLDPRRASVIDKYNKRRIIRSIEIARALGRSPLKHQRHKYGVLWIGLTMPPQELRARINERLRKRLKQGMAGEAKQLHADGLTYKRMDGLGLEYRSLAKLLQHKIDRKELESELQIAIWHFARRQMTYWRRNKEIAWFDQSTQSGIEKTVKNWLR